jgi:hypothetical protein
MLQCSIKPLNLHPVSQVQPLNMPNIKISSSPDIAWVCSSFVDKSVGESADILAAPCGPKVNLINPSYSAKLALTP